MSDEFLAEEKYPRSASSQHFADVRQFVSEVKSLLPKGWRISSFDYDPGEALCIRKGGFWKFGKVVLIFCDLDYYSYHNHKPSQQVALSIAAYSPEGLALAERIKEETKVFPVAIFRDY